MKNIDTDLLYVAYKNMVLKNLETGFFDQHASEADYLYLRGDEKLFFHCVELCNKKYMINKFMEKFLEVNKDLKNDADFLKKLLCRLDEKSASWASGADIAIGKLDGDTDAMLGVIKALGEYFMNSKAKYLPRTRMDKKLKDLLLENGLYRFSYFDFPYEKSSDFIHKALEQDPSGYLYLDNEDIRNKNYLFKSIDTCVNLTQKMKIKEIYEKVPEDLKLERDVICKFVDAGFFKQKNQAFSDNVDIFSSVLNNDIKAKKIVNLLRDWNANFDQKVWADNKCLREFFKSIKLSLSDSPLIMKSNDLPEFKDMLLNIRKVNKYFASKFKVSYIKDLSVNEAFFEIPEICEIELSALILNNDLSEINKAKGEKSLTQAKKVKI